MRRCRRFGVERGDLPGEPEIAVAIAEAYLKALASGTCEQLRPYLGRPTEHLVMGDDQRPYLVTAVAVRRSSGGLYLHVGVHDGHHRRADHRDPVGPLGGGGRRVRSRAAAGAQAGRIARSLDIDSRRGEGRRNSSTRQDVARKGSGGDCWARACPAFWTTIPRAPRGARDGTLDVRRWDRRRAPRGRCGRSLDTLPTYLRASRHSTAAPRRAARVLITRSREAANVEHPLAYRRTGPGDGPRPAVGRAGRLLQRRRYRPAELVHQSRQRRPGPAGRRM